MIKKHILKTAIIVSMCALCTTACNSPESTPNDTLIEEEATNDVNTTEPVVEDTENETKLPDEEEDSLVQSADNIPKIFSEYFLENPVTDLTTTDIVTNIIESNLVPINLTGVNIEAGFLTGFKEEITGFDRGTMFAPMIGSLPFVGYVFEVNDNQEDFVEKLKEFHDLRWNICTEADEMIVVTNENMVLFLMCPTSTEEQTE